MGILEGFLQDNEELLDSKVEEETVEDIVVGGGFVDDNEADARVDDIAVNEVEEDGGLDADSLADQQAYEQMTESEMLDQVEFAENPDPRVPVMVIIDTSGSMIDEFPMLEEGVTTLIDEIKSDELASRRAEISFVMYGTDVDEPTKFATINNIERPEIRSRGLTSTGEAIIVALDSLEDRKKVYNTQGVDYYRAIVLLLTDGAPTDDIDEATRRISDGEAAKKFSFFSVGTNDVAVEALKGLTKRSPLRMKDGGYVELFKWLSASTTSVSASQVGDSVPVPSIEGWASFD